MRTGTILDRTRKRLATYSSLRQEGANPRQAAAQMGVSERTAERYEHLRRTTLPTRQPARPPGPADLVPVPVGGMRRGCGTYLAWLLHQTLGENPCQVCLEAQYTRQRIPGFEAMRAADEAARLHMLTLITKAASNQAAPLITPGEAAGNRAVLAEAVSDLYTPRARRRAKVAA